MNGSIFVSPEKIYSGGADSTGSIGVPRERQKKFKSLRAGVGLNHRNRPEAFLFYIPGVLMAEFYHIKLFSKGRIEVFQNTFWHKVHIKDGRLSVIEIRYSSARNQGSCTYSTRSMEEVYAIEVGNEGNFYHSGDPDPNIIVEMHGYYLEVANG